MNLIKYLREKKNKNLFVKKIFLLKHILLHFYKKTRLEVLIYDFYCQIFLKKHFINILPNVSINEKKIFNENNILIKENYLDNELLKSVKYSFNENIINKNLVTNDDLIIKKPNFIKNLYYKFFLNTIVHEKFPLSWLSETSQIKNPLKNISGLNELLKNYILPVANQLSESNLECFRCTAFRTKNKNEKETYNSQSHWHTDGDPKSFLKFMLYLNDVDDMNGPFTYKKAHSDVEEVKIKGSLGTTFFFRSSKLVHKGSNTISNHRDAIIFLFIPSKKNVIHQHDAKPDYIRKFIPFFPNTKKARFF